MMEQVINALKKIRCHVITDEYKLHKLIANELMAAGISFSHEVPLAPRNRIDFLTAGGIGIEAKKGKPNELSVYRQLERYVSFEEVKGLILVIERYMDLPESLMGSLSYPSASENSGESQVNEVNRKWKQ